MVITVYIDGDKNGFISKNSIDKFKKNIKNIIIAIIKIGVKSDFIRLI